MASVKFEDNSVQVLNAFNRAVYAFLEEAAGELESEAKRNTRVNSEQTKNSWKHKINRASAEAYVGSRKQNAIWEEFGTGEYALKGDGRKGGWKYKDKKGVWHFTYGKTPNRALHKAKITCEPKIIRAAEDKFGSLDK